MDKRLQQSGENIRNLAMSRTNSKNTATNKPAYSNEVGNTEDVAEQRREKRRRWSNINFINEQEEEKLVLRQHLRHQQGAEDKRL